jgi:hypothetical protein
MLDPADPIHQWCDFLVLDSPYELLQWVATNGFLHSRDGPNWPDFLVAFASNGCGDYFAYDLRSDKPRIVYMDPDYTVAENLAADDKLEYGTFEEWYSRYASRHPTLGAD